jgi:outer membrane protein assembly factor BamD
MQSHTPSSARRRWNRVARFIVLGLMLFGLAVSLGGCRKDERPAEITADEIYEKAKYSLDAGAWERSIALYKTLQTRYPFGRYTEQSMLDIAYAYYQRGDVESALSTLDRFIRTYPAHPNVDYAYYLKGLVNFEQNQGFLERLMPSRVSDRDQSSAQASFDDFNELLRRFPNSRYALDARQRMVFLRNNLADYEVIVAEYYLRRGALIAAVNRARYAVEVYPNTPAIPEALKILHIAYTELELPELAQDAWDVLALNYPDHYYVLGERKERSWVSRLWPFD